MIQLYNLMVQIILWGIRRLPEGHSYRQWLALRDVENFDTQAADDSILFACASVGEYEAIKEIAQLLRQREKRIHLMFFSSSGYEYAEQYAAYDHLSYSPLDTPWRINQYLRKYPTEGVIISGSYYWPVFLRELRWHHIPYYCVDVRLHLSAFRSLYNYWLKRQLSKAALVTSYSPSTIKELKRSRIDVMSTPPMRLATLHHMDEIELPHDLDSFIQGAEKLIIYGSTHREDIDILSQVDLPEDYNLIIAPHHIDEANIRYIEQNYPCATRLSQTTSTITSEVLILDSIGLLKHLYKYAVKAYIGGGFKQGIHNTLEPAIYGIPIAIGPMHSRFPETAALIDSGQATITDNTTSLQEWIWSEDKLYHIPSIWSSEEAQRAAYAIAQAVLG